MSVENDEIVCDFADLYHCHGDAQVVSFDDGFTVTTCQTHVEEAEAVIEKYASESGQNYEEEI